MSEVSEESEEENPQGVGEEGTEIINMETSSSESEPELRRSGRTKYRPAILMHDKIDGSPSRVYRRSDFNVYHVYSVVG